MARSTPRRRAEPTRPWARRRNRGVPVTEPAPATPTESVPVGGTEPPTGRSRATTSPSTEEASPAVATEASAAPPATAPPPSNRSRLGTWLLALVWLLLTLGGTALLVIGLFEPLATGRVEVSGLTVDLDAAWVPDVGAVAVATAYVWALAARTGGRPVVFGLLTLVMGGVVLAVDDALLRNGAAVMTCVVSAVLAIVATVPAVRLRTTVREVLVATAVAAVGGLATAGFSPDADRMRFEYVTLALALVGAFGLIYRLGAGLHGLGRRGVVIVVVGAVVLGLTLAYAELLRRYGTPGLVAWLLDGVGWLKDTLGASPRPIVALLGIPALVWGTHMRARRRQGWWVCAFGVGATVPIAQALLAPRDTWDEQAMALGYGIAIGLVVGALLVLADLALTGNRGRRGRRAETAGAVRPEPPRVEALL